MYDLSEIPNAQERHHAMADRIAEFIGEVSCENPARALELAIKCIKIMLLHTGGIPSDIPEPDIFDGTTDDGKAAIANHLAKTLCWVMKTQTTDRASMN